MPEGREAAPNNEHNKRGAGATRKISVGDLVKANNFNLTKLKDLLSSSDLSERLDAYDVTGAKLRIFEREQLPLLSETSIKMYLATASERAVNEKSPVGQVASKGWAQDGVERSQWSNLAGQKGKNELERLKKALPNMPPHGRVSLDPPQIHTDISLL
ncbi:MAG: hypothetical protein Q9188_005199 [Gyalolechia gomerana]